MFMVFSKWRSSRLRHTQETHIRRPKPSTDDSQMTAFLSPQLATLHAIFHPEPQTVPNAPRLPAEPQIVPNAPRLPAEPQGVPSAPQLREFCDENIAHPEANNSTISALPEATDCSSKELGPPPSYNSLFS